MKNDELIIQAEKDIRYIYEQMLNILKRYEQKDVINEMTFFINDDNIASGFVRKGNMTDTLYQQNIQAVGKDLKPKITVMVSNGHMSVAHHPSKLTSVFVQKNPETDKSSEGWEEIW